MPTPAFAPKHGTRFKLINVNEYTTGAEASLTMNFDNKNLNKNTVLKANNETENLV